MISFPSTMNKGGGGQVKGKIVDTTLSENYQNITAPINKERQLEDKVRPTISSQELVEYNRYNTDSAKTSNKLDFNLIEDPYLLTLNEIKESMNTYKEAPIEIKVPLGNDFLGTKENDKGKKSKNYKEYYGAMLVSRSLFNPINAVNVIGMTENVPLMDYNEYDLDKAVGTQDDTSKIATESFFYKEVNSEDNIVPISAKNLIRQNVLNRHNTSDCTIKKLVELSGQDPSHSSLGRAIYKYADFMYCADLGKIPNNHLITLRRFAYPVGDNIFRNVSQNQDTNPNYTPPDVGRMVAWFGTEDNKLENLLSYSFHATWTDKVGKRELVDTTAEAGKDNFLQKLANTMNPSYGDFTAQGFAGGGNDYLSSMGVSLFGLPKSGDVDTEILTDYDKNKVYTPLNVFNDVAMYEGQLKFKQTITLKFRYKLRAYDNINPKSAFLDLLANVLAVTYRRGKFWGGSRPTVGPTRNTAPFKFANDLIDGCTDRLTGLFGQICNGGFDISAIQGAISNLLSGFGFGNIMNGAKNFVTDGFNAAKGVIENPKNLQKAKETLEGLGKKFIQTIGGLAKNKLGRPQVYALHSILSADDVGFWHLTIGNPRNPIAVMGNLILDDAKITHTGALGVDDFPSELIVEVTLRHGRGKDSQAIERMYTKGSSTIYQSYIGSLTIPTSNSKEKKTVNEEQANNDFTKLFYTNSSEDMLKMFGDKSALTIHRMMQEMG